MSLISTWASEHLGLLTWIPGLVMIIQAILTVFILLCMIIGIIIVPGRLLKIAALTIGLVSLLIVWFV